MYPITWQNQLRVNIALEYYMRNGDVKTVETKYRCHVKNKINTNQNQVKLFYPFQIPNLITNTHP